MSAKIPMFGSLWQRFFKSSDIAKPVVGMSGVSKILWGMTASTAIMYFLFQKKMLPLPVAKVVSKLLFYPTFPITLMMRLGNIWTHVDDTVILGVAPMKLLQHPTLLHDEGVRGVVNMCFEYEGPITEYSRLGIEQLRIPCVDHFEPSVDQMHAATQFIKKFQKRGEKVYVHCKAGHGRAASVALSWMMVENKSRTPKVTYLLLFARCFQQESDVVTVFDNGFIIGLE
jgi:atypical dual specificity phosphatase